MLRSIQKRRSTSKASKCPGRGEIQEKTTHHILTALHLRQVPHLVQIPLTRQVRAAQVRDALDAAQPAHVVETRDGREVGPARETTDVLEGDALLLLSEARRRGRPAGDGGRVRAEVAGGPARLKAGRRRHGSRLMVLRLEVGEALLLLLLLLRLLLLVRHPPTRGVGLPYQILIPREELHEDRVAVRLDHLAEAVDARRGVHGREGADGVAYGKVLLGLASRGGLLLLADDDAGRLRRRLLLLLLGLGAGRVGTVRLEEDLVAVLVVQGLSGRAAGD